MAPPNTPWNKIVAQKDDKTPRGPSKATPKQIKKSANVVVPPESPSVAKELPSYAQTQNDEIEALQAIYMKDFEEVEVKGAWSKAERAFRLRLRASSDSNTAAVLSVRFTATYPKTLPLLFIEDVEKSRTKTHQALQELVRTKPKELLGEVMIYEIATAIQDILEDEVQSRERGEALPSLEEERAVHEAAATERIKQQEQDMLKKQEEEKAEEDRLLQRMVDEEINRRKELKRRSRHAIPQTGNALESISPTSRLAIGPVTEIFTVEQGIATPPLIMKRVTIAHAQETAAGNKQREAFKRMKMQLEDELEALKRLRHPSLINVLEYKLESSMGSDWQISVLTEFANRGSLSDMLEIVETLPVARMRSWSIEILEALDFLHRHGIVHKSVHVGNVLLSRPLTSGDTISIKLADAGFQRTLHDLHDLANDTNRSTSSRSAFWEAPESSNEKLPRQSRKTDIWDSGIVFLQMLFGLDTANRYGSPASLMDSLDLSAPLEDMLSKLFKSDPRKRPSGFDLIPSEFLRNDVPVLSEPSSPVRTRLSSSTSLPVARDRRLRRESTPFGGSFSRYASEWVEAGRLGRGGYGEVVKARNKLDGRIYAIKKIKQTSALDEVLSEVMLLSRLDHPYVVRYYTAWPEEEFSNVDETDEEAVSFTEAEPSSLSTGDPLNAIEFGQSTGGLDFISSTGYPKIEFGNDSDSDEAVSSESDGEEEDAIPRRRNGATSGSVITSEESGKPLSIRRTTSSTKPRPTRTTLYIQMEYCERHTLRDLIRRGLHDKVDEGWRLFRQILEGLVHIHANGVIHRDLKPDNIFINSANNPKIGDFGLATSGQYHLADKAISSGNVDGDMTRSIGTTLYVAPELRSNVAGSYSDKVDMYSLGIIFFEMCHHLGTAMERDQVLRKLREKEHTLPPELQSGDKALQGSIINALISHRPSERPSSSELLTSGKIPLQIEDETIRQALHGLSDPTSPYYHQIMSALFAQTSNRQIKDLTWDSDVNDNSHMLDANDILLQGIVKDRLTAVFRRHGAVEVQRQPLFPRSPHYTNQNVAQLLDASGTLVQLPYDLILPHARSLAKQPTPAEKTFTFGNVYRGSTAGGAPRTIGEADFDIVTDNTKDLSLKEAEVIKVIDELIDEFSFLATSQICFHINHADLLDLIMDYCHISKPLRPAVKEVLSKLNVQQWTWQKIRSELRSPQLSVSSTSLDDMARFDFRDTPERALEKIRATFDNSDYVNRANAVFAHLQSVISYLKQLGLRRKLYISPLSSFNEKFYAGGILFQCVFDTKKRDVLAAGGRYDRLIEEHKPRAQGQFTRCHAVGMNIGWDRLVTSMARYQRKAGKSTNYLKKSTEDENHQKQLATRRCDILIASFDPAILRSTGVKLVGELWAHDLSAELAIDTRSPEELLAHYRDDKHSWIVIIKHDAIGTGKPDLKVKSMVRKEDTDVRSAELLSYLRGEIRDRDHREGTNERAKLLRQPSHPEVPQGRSNVQVLMAQHRSKKSNKWNVVEAAQTRARDLLASYQSAPIAAVETRDDILDMIRETRLSDPDSWRRIIQAVPLADRQYLQQVHDLLGKYAASWREGTAEEDMSRVAFVYNFRTGGCILYDLGL